MRRCLATFAVAAALLPAAAEGAVRTVDILPGEFDPPVIVVAPGTGVEFKNGDLRTRALRGDFDSPDIAPGATFTRRFPRIGRFDYRDRDNAAVTGTVIVSARGGRRPRYPVPGGDPGRMVEHRWRGTLRVDLRENWKYYDGKFQSFEGPCNAEVGDGSRLVSFHADFSDVRYTSVGASTEILQATSSPYRIQRYRERIDAKTSDPSSGRTITCPDGSSDPPPDIEQKCDHDYSGRRVRADLAWSPRSTRGRFLWPHKYLGARPPSSANCGDSFLGFLDSDALPFDPGAGDALLYDFRRTGPVTIAEARALRGGRAVTIVRSLELHFTKDCCAEWHQEDKPGTYVRAGAHFDVFGKVTIRLRPR